MQNADHEQATGDVGYRPELDGIRALAILSVLGFHVGFSDWSGGYLGVDVFFVLSGWLICGHIYENLKAGRFNVASFFARRIRRLIPAAFTCYLVVTLVVLALFLPFEQQAYLRYLLGSAFFVNNFVLAQETGYFAPAGLLNPLLHTWSLSIEEQFYLLIPCLAVLMAKNARAFVLLLGLAFATSLALTLLPANSLTDPGARYYSSVLRVWEIAAGGLAYTLTRGRTLPRLPGLAGLAFLLVAVPVFVFDETLRHPGPGTTLVVAGTIGLILFARPDRSLTGRILGSRPMNLLGRISYSTYLWHWPLIVFLSYVGHEFSDETRVLVVLASFTIGYLSYRVIEMPVRRMTVPDRNRALFSGFAVQSLAILGLASALWIQTDGKKAGELGEIATIMNTGAIGNARWGDCWYSPETPEACTFGSDNRAARPIVLWGDSMANSAVAAFDRFATARGAAGVAYVSPGCAPLLGVAYVFGDPADCIAMNAAVLATLQEQPASDIYMFARWPMYFLRYPADDLSAVGMADFVGSDLAGLDRDSQTIVETALEQLLAALPRHHRIHLIGPVPEHTKPVPAAMMNEIRFGVQIDTLTRAVFEERTRDVRERMRAIATKAGAAYVDPVAAFCDRDICPHHRDGVPIFADTVHLTGLGNDLLLTLLEGR